MLKGYLRCQLQDEKGNVKPNRARDKLLRLSVTQFMELSTDIYDELIRREDERLHRVANVPKSLLPKPTFHPKRNQARQKLSTLPMEPFRQLATDVFYELERRVPRFAGGDIDRPSSSTSSASRGGMRPAPGAGLRGGPPGQGAGRRLGSNGFAPPTAQYQSFRSASPAPNGPAPGTRPPMNSSESGSFGRPLPRTFQSNTIVPNKSTMVEDDDDDEDEDTFGLEKVVSGIGALRDQNFGANRSDGDREKIKEQESEIVDLKGKFENLERRLLHKEREIEEHEGAFRDREEELKKLRTLGRDREEELSTERNEWHTLRDELEQKHLDAQRLNNDLQRELEQLQSSRSEDEHETRAETDRQMENLRNLNDILQQELQQLQQSKSQGEREMRSQTDRQLEDLRVQLGDSHRETVDDLRTQLGMMADQTSDLHRQLHTHQVESEELRRQLHSQQKLQQTASHSDYERRIELLEQELAHQEKLTKEVRDEAMAYLREMRDLSRQNDAAVEQEEKLAVKVGELEAANEHWRVRYARLRAQNKSLRASTIGLGFQTPFDARSLARTKGVVSEGGLVRDVDMTRYQIAIDELLKAARQPSTEPLLSSVKSVTICVQSITSHVGTDGYPTPIPSPLSPSTNPPHHRPESVAKRGL